MWKHFNPHPSYDGKNIPIINPRIMYSINGEAEQENKNRRCNPWNTDDSRENHAVSKFTLCGIWWGLCGRWAIFFLCIHLNTVKSSWTVSLCCWPKPSTWQDEMVRPCGVVCFSFSMLEFLPQTLLPSSHTGRTHGKCGKSQFKMGEMNAEKFYYYLCIISFAVDI